MMLLSCKLVKRILSLPLNFALVVSMIFDPDGSWMLEFDGVRGDLHPIGSLLFDGVMYNNNPAKSINENQSSIAINIINKNK